MTFRNPGSSIYTIVLVLIAFLFCFLILLAASIFQARTEAARSAMNRASAAAQVVATNAKWINELAHQALQRIDETLSDLSIWPDGQIRNIAEAVANLPGDVKVYVVDSNGQTLFSTDPQVREAGITDRGYFTSPASGQTWYTSPLMISRLSGQQIFVFSRRLERAGKFAGVAIISFDVALFERIWKSLDLDRASTVSIIRDDGQLIARYPFADGPLDMSNYVLFTEYLPRAETGTYRAISPADGVPRFVGYQKVEGTEIVAVSSVSAAAAYASFWRHTYWTLGLFVPAAFALAGGAAWIIWLVRIGYERQLALERTLEINKLLLRDTHHRVKNNLQSVQSLLRMQDIPEQTKLDLQARIAAMTAVHEHMYRFDQYQEIEAQQLVPSIVEPLVRTFGADNVQVQFDIDPIVVDRDHATPLSLLLSELVTNALKYAFDGGRGNISISLKSLKDGGAELRVKDDGIGFDADAVRPGMGTRLIKGMLQQLGGAHSYRHSGGTEFVASAVLRGAAQPSTSKA